MRSIGIDQGLRPIGQAGEGQPPFAGFGDPLVPLRPALRLQGQGLHGLDAGDGLAEGGDFQVSAADTRANKVRKGRR